MDNDHVDGAPTGGADADLVLRARSGDREAYAELWRRHYRSGITVARSITNSLDPDDLVQEAYARIYQAIRRGGGRAAPFAPTCSRASATQPPDGGARATTSRSTRSKRSRIPLQQTRRPPTRSTAA